MGTDLRCKNCNDKIPITNEWDNEPEEGTEHFVRVYNPGELDFVRKKEDYFCSIECLSEFCDK